MEQDIFGLMIGAVVLLFIMGIIWLISNFMLGGYISPMTKSLNPNSTTGIQYDQYNQIADHLELGGKYFFYIIFGVIFLYVLIKALFDREQTNPGGLYG